MHAETIITVRYAQGTWLARVKGCKKTASCVYSAIEAARALARKLELDAGNLKQFGGGGDYLEFKANPLRRLPMAWKMVPVMPTIAMAEAGKRALEAGGTADEVWAAMLVQTPSPEAQPPQCSQSVREEAQ